MGLARLDQKAQAASLLRGYFKKLKQEKAGVSIRSLAQDLGLSATFTSDILNGKKALPVDRIDRWVEVLGIDFHDRARLENLVGEPAPTEVAHAKPKRKYHLVPAEQFSLLKNWYYLAMLNLTTCRDFDGDFAGRLGISEHLAELAVRELLRRGLLVEKEGRLIKSKKSMRWATPNPSADVRAHHAQMMTKARNHLLEDYSQEALDRRLISGLTFAGSSAKLAKAKEKLSACLHEIAEDLADGDADEVFQLSVQLFALSKRRK